MLSYPLLPNPLKIFSLDLMSGISKYEMFTPTSRDILQEFCIMPEAYSIHFRHTV